MVWRRVRPGTGSPPPPDGRPPGFVRVRVRAQRDPVRYATIVGTVVGATAGGLAAVLATFVFSLLAVGAVGAPSLLTGVAVAVPFGLFHGVTAFRGLPSTPMPPDTDRARLTAARDLLRSGAPGAGPETGQVARHLAETALGATDWSMHLVIAHVTVLSICVWNAVAADPVHSAAGIGIALLSLLLSALMVAYVYLWRPQRARARAFLDACGRHEPVD
ncbi:hypothetical protein [Nocardiopsis sp. LOL_012]|uniref:hypothetical protein n=1 Tax=Nocardiopsis sp. LOL_012 TaxID=3345409 RepID=UPI003A84CA15